MFTLDDLFNIFNYLKGDPVDNLDGNLKIQALAERTKAESLFENTIDQICYGSDDYKRLKKFLIDWYSSFRTILESEKQSLDIFGMPNSNLDELFRSFGFNYSNEIDSFFSKSNFFLDLVNLYKIKGTPQALIQVLNYYGITDVDIFEFFVQKRESDGDIIFHPVQVNSSLPGEKPFPTPDVLFEVLTSDDPHWMMTKADIERLIKANKIALPSKSPYFSIRPTYKLFKISIPLAILQRTIQDQYTDWIATGIPPERIIQISKLNYSASLIELYLSCAYTFNTYYNRTHGSSDQNFLCYDGTNNNSIDIISEWEDLIALPATRAERESKLVTYFDSFTRPISSNFLQPLNSAGNTLNLLHPNLKDSIDTLLIAGQGFELLKSLLRDLSGWLKTHVGPDYPDIATTMLGLEALDFMFDVINFFKPYHARLSTVEILYASDSPLLDSIRLSDPLQQNIYQTFVDFDTCNSIPCCSGSTTIDSTSVSDTTACMYYARETYDCGSYYDAGAACDKDHFDTTAIQYVTDAIVCSPDSTSITVQEGSYVPFDFDPTPMPYSQSATILFWQDGLWPPFDEGSSFDCPGGRDICNIYQLDSTGVCEISWDSTADTTSVILYTIGHGTSLPADTFRVWNSSTDPQSTALVFSITDSVAWLNCDPLIGASLDVTDKQIIDINYNVSGLSLGSHSGTIEIAAINACNNSPQNIYVELTVVPVETIAVDSTGLTVAVGQGFNPADQSFNIWNSGLGTLTYSIADDQTWLDQVPSSGTSTGEHDPIVVSFITSHLVAGSYNANIIISSASATNTPQTIPVSLVVSQPTIAIDSTGVIATAVQGNNALSQTFEVWNSGPGGLIYTISDDAAWLNVVPNSGISVGEHDTINVNFTTSGLSAGNYSATITVSASGATNTPQTIPVSLEITQPTIAFDTTGVIATSMAGNNAPSQTFEIWNSGPGTLAYTISDDAAWLNVVPNSGTSSGEHDTLTINFTNSGLARGNYSATITVSSAIASNSPQTIPVSLVVSQPTISVDTTGVISTAIEGNNAPSQTFEIWNSGAGTLIYTISNDQTSWLNIVPDSGTSTGEHDTLTVNFTNSGLSAGNYSATITVSSTSATNTPYAIPVDLTVFSAVPPMISTDTTGITAIATFGHNDAPPQTFDIWNGGSGTINYEMDTDSSAWITVIPLTGSSTGEHDSVTVSFDPADLIVATHSGNIIITSAEAVNSPVTIPVSMIVDGTATVEAAQVLAEVEANVEEKIEISQAQLDVEFIDGDELRMTEAQLDVEMTENTGIQVYQVGLQVEASTGDEMDVSQLYVQVEVDYV